MISQFDLVYFVRAVFVDRVNTIDSGRIFIVLAKVDAWEDDKSYDSESAFWCLSPEHLNTLETNTFPFLMDKRDSDYHFINNPKIQYLAATEIERLGNNVSDFIWDDGFEDESEESEWG